MKVFFQSTDPAHLRCSSAALGNFTKQLGVLLGAGIPLHECLDSLTRVQTDNLTLFVAPELRSKVTNGYRLSSAMSQYPKIFPKTYLALIRGSEETGELVSVLEQLGEWLDTQSKIEQHVKKALTYPVFVIVLAAILTLVLFKTVVPQILDTVIGLGAELPLPTKILLGFIATIESPIFWLLLVLTVAAVGWYLRTPDGHRKFMLVCHFTPVLGGILVSSGCARFSHTLAMLLGSGVDVIRSCHIAAESSGNPLIKEDAQRVASELREGRYLSDTLDARPFYPRLLIDMVKVGDESGQMSNLISRCAGLLEEDTMHRLDMFMNLLEPIVLAGVSLIVGSVLIAILLPMSNLISAL